MKKAVFSILLYTIFCVSTQSQIEQSSTKEISIDSTTKKAVDTLATIALCIDTLVVVDTTTFDPPTPYSEPQNSKEYWYNMWSSPRFKKATFQRDSLQKVTQLLKRDTALLRKDTALLKKDTTLKADSIRNLLAKNNAQKNQYNLLTKEHDSLRVNSAKTASKLSGTIDQQNKQLLEREKKLNDMLDMLSQREVKIKELEDQIKRQDSLANALNDALKQALNSFNSEDLKLEMRNGKVYVSLFDKLLFKSGSATLETPGREALQQLAEVLNKTPNIDIQVEGHTDSIPMRGSATYPDNWALSAARSLSIVRTLTESFGVDPRIVISAAHAEFNPLTSNATPAGRAKNRRTEIILTPRLGDLFNMLKDNNIGNPLTPVKNPNPPAKTITPKRKK